MLVQLTYFGRKYLQCLLLLAWGIVGVSCGGTVDSEENLKQNVDSFAAAYFDWDFEKAVPYTTSASHVWLRYAASQVHQADIDLLNSLEQGAVICIDDITYNAVNDSLAQVRLTVQNFVEMDTIGAVGHLREEATFVLEVLHAHGKWQVQLNGLPRREKKG